MSVHCGGGLDLMYVRYQSNDSSSEFTQDPDLYHRINSSDSFTWISTGPKIKRKRMPLLVKTSKQQEIKQIMVCR